MKNIKKIIFISLVLFILIFINGCNSKVTLSLSQYDINIKVGDTYEINPIVENLENPEFNYVLSSNEFIRIDDNIITGYKKGELTITISLKNNEDVPSVILNVIVDNVDPTHIITETNVSILLGENYQIEHSFLPEIAYCDVMYDVIEGASAIKVDEKGLVTSLSAGCAIVRITTRNISVKGLSVDITIQVRGHDVPVFHFNDEYKDNLIINWGTDYDYMKGITATDLEDGDITSSISISKKVNNQNYGKQTIRYRVQDRDGNEAVFDRTVEVVWNYDVQFIGHAGSYYGVMNSEEAILYAIQVLKYQCVEIDLKQTKDGVFVLCHDDTFGGVQIANTNWDDLKNVTDTKTRKADLPAKEGPYKNGGVYTTKLCTLERYLDICKRYNVTAVIELKSSAGISNSNQSRMQALMDEIEEAGMLENVIFLGSAYNCLIWTRKNGYEYIPCQYLVNSCENETYLKRCIDNNLDISINVTGGYSNSEAWIARYKEAGLKVSTFTYTQYVDYDVVQEWIDKGVDFVTCDWHRMHKLDLPESSNEPKAKYNVVFKDSDGSVLKQSSVEEGKFPAAPSVNAKEGYEFVGWDKELSKVISDIEYTAKYEPITYSISYMSNVEKITESTWSTKDEFVTDFYNDLFDWIKENKDNIDGLTVSGDNYSLTRNGVTVTFTSGETIKALYVYDFEKTISNILYKPVTRNSDGTCVILEDENYFLNSKDYRIKYQDMDQWLYNCIKTSYTAYDTTYKPTSAGKIQIFFRMHQWMNGTIISAFNNYPSKYIVEVDETINVVMPTSPISYTILDKITLPNPTGNVEFLGWFLTSDCSGEAITEIPVGSTGNIVLYAKWKNS